MAEIEEVKLDESEKVAKVHRVDIFILGIARNFFLFMCGFYYAKADWLNLGIVVAGFLLGSLFLSAVRASQEKVHVIVVGKKK